MFADVQSPLLQSVKGLPKFTKKSWERVISAVLITLVFCIVSVSLFILTFQRPNSRFSRMRITRTADITIAQGHLRGYALSSREGESFYAFYKIPYAKPPVGTLRFKNPLPADGWRGIRDVKNVAPQCIQKENENDGHDSGTVGDEDCLYANVYTRRRFRDGAKRPVMVFIHGGDWVENNGSRYGAEYFMDEGIVLVTFQYRLGPLGFLKSDDGKIEGNQGFKDQVMMLQWIQTNIVNFGGDPGRVTIFGSTAGAASVGLHMLSPMSSGLFHRAISQSSASLCASKIDSNPSKIVRQIAETVNCISEDESLLSCLQSKPVEDIVLARSSMTLFTVTVGDKFMPDKPFNLLMSNASHKVPYIIGVNNAELLSSAQNLLNDPETVLHLNQDFAAILHSDLSEEDYSKVRQYYFEDKPIDNRALWNFTDFLTDAVVSHCSYLSAKLHSRMAPTYTYYLTKPPLKHGNSVSEFVSRGYELSYMFNFEDYPKIVKNDNAHFAFSKNLVKIWSHFADTGVPSMNEDIWKKWESNESFWYELADIPKQTHFLDERMKFWDQFSYSQLRYV